MKSILFIAFLALATIGCDTPEKSTNSDTSAPPMSSDTSTSMPTDTTSTTPTDTTSSPTSPTDTTTTR